MVDRKMTKIQEEVWNFLLTRHAGEENAMPRAAILTRFNLVRHKTISDREFREIVSELVTVYKKAICTTPVRGYFVARTVAEKNHAINYLDSVLTEVGDRRRALAEADPLERQERLF
jgi:hypothetical protein